MQHQIKRPGFPMGGVQIPKPKDLLAQVPDVSQVLAPKPKRAVTRCGNCGDPNCGARPVTIEIDE